MTGDVAGAGAVDLGGCEGCALGCAVACADGLEDRATAARRVLVGSGISILLLSVGPGLVARQLVVLGVSLVSAALGVVVASLAAVAVRRGRPAGDGPARLAYRLLPFGVAAMSLTWVGSLLARIW